MSLRFSTAGPEFPEQLVDALLTGDVVFLCGAGVSAPQLPGFGALVTRCFVDLNVEMSLSEKLSFDTLRFEEALGSLSRRIVDPTEMIRSVVDQLQVPLDADLSHHRTILRLSRDLENRPAVVTTNFDTLIERALLEKEEGEFVRGLSFAGQDLPPPGSAGFGGIIHIHGRIADPVVRVNQTPLIVTSADYGDAYMRAGWASRFLFDLSRCKTIVLVGYSAGDAPVRYFLNVLEADRERFPDLRPVYAVDGVTSREHADVRWAALAVEPIAYELLPNGNGDLTSHAALWRDLERLADLVERPRRGRREWAQTILSRPIAETDAADLDHVAWLLDGRQDLWPVAIQCVSDPAWLDFFAERRLWGERDAPWIVAAWMVRDLQSVERCRKAIDWIGKLGTAFADEMERRLWQAKDVPENWLRLWRLVTISRPDRADIWEDRAYALMAVLKGPVVLHHDLERAVTLLAPTLELRSGMGFDEDEAIIDTPERLSDLCWPRLTLPDRGGAPELVDALANTSEPLTVLEIATARLRTATGLSVDARMTDSDYDASDTAVPSIEPHAQNEHHDGPIFLVELIARTLEPAAAADREAVRRIASSWKTMPGRLGLRLWLHALRQPQLFGAEEALSGVAGLPLDAFWTVRRELAVLLRDRAGAAPFQIVADVEGRFLTEGAAYYSRYSVEEGQPDWPAHALDAEVWLRLNMLGQARRLSPAGAAELAAIRHRRPYLDRDVEDRDFFRSYSTGVHLVVGDPQPIVHAADGERLQVAREVIGSHDIEKREGWSVFCRTNPQGALDTLADAPLDAANAPLWRDLAGGLSFPEDELDSGRRRIVVAVFHALEGADDAFLQLVAGRLADLYWSSPRRLEPAIAAWWPRLFAAAVARDEEALDPSRDLYADLINTPAGRLTQAALVDIEVLRAEGTPIDPALLDAIWTAAAAPGRQGTMARGALVYAAGFVLTVVGEQMAEPLGAALTDDGDEGRALRRVLVTDGRLSSIASRTFGAAILRGLDELTGQGHDLTNAAAKIIGPALGIVRGEQTDADWGFGTAAVSRALRTGPPGLRIGAAELLTQWIHQIDTDRAIAWRAGIGPMLREVWPRERRFSERGLSRHFADLAVQSADAFPDALGQLMPYITQIEGHGGTFTIERSEAPERFPRDTLALLWRLYGPGTTSNLHSVPKILDRLVAAMPAIETDRRLQWLEQRAVRYE
ncbi:SIR2 family protein [Sphingomonas sp. RB1R13]|uniref:SIR2 family protein n=1 Tax=Sphingomonas sp. RB1R13 TaxID=3096159 RepID=UPI002FC7B9ED